MEPERGPSSPHQNSLWHLFLLGILAFFSWRHSKRKTPIQPVPTSIAPSAKTTEKNEQYPNSLPLVSSQLPPSPPGTEHSCKCCHHKTPWWKIILDVGTFFAVFAYAYIANNQLTQMRKTTEIDQRPYIISDGRPEFITLPATLHPQVNVAFKDVGKTPAKSEISFQRLIPFRDLSADRSREENAVRFTRFIQQQFDELNAEADKAAKSPLYGHEDIAPGEVSPWFTMELFSPITEDDLPKIVNGDVVLLCLGLERYLDSFGNKYQSDFCSFYMGNDPSVWHHCGTHETVK